MNWLNDPATGERRFFRETILLAAVAAVPIVICLGLLNQYFFKPFSKRQNYFDCQSKVSRIGIAFENFIAKHRTLPPAYSTNAEGTPLLSWRVLLLPFFTYADQTTVSRFQLDQPWNSAQSLALQDTYANLYHCLDDPSPQLQTSYVVVVGPGTPFPGRKPASPPDAPDDTKGEAGTILMVETAMSGIHWMEPRDMPFNDAIRGIDVLPEKGITSRHPFPFPGGSGNEVHVLFSDGCAHPLRSDMDPRVLRMLLELKVPKPDFKK